jgi:PKD repeat protein
MKSTKIYSAKAMRWQKLFSFVLLFFLTSLSISAQRYDTCVKADFNFKTDQLSAKFIARGSGPILQYHWDFGDGTTGSSNEIGHRYTKAGDYKVCLTVYGYDSINQTRCKFEICKKVTVQCELKLDFGYRQDQFAFKFEAKSNSQNAVYSWDFGDGSFERGRSVGHRYTKAGRYKVCVTAKDTVTGCSSTVCKVVTIEKPCKLEGDFHFSTSDLDAKFEAKSNSRTAQYYWSFGDGENAKGRIAKHSYALDGKYKVCLTIKDSVLDCAIVICKEVEVKNPCKLKGDFTYRQSGNKFGFKARSNSNIAVYTWDFGDGNTGSGKVIRHQYAQPGVYKVCVIISDKRQKCRIEICKRVVVKDTCKLKADFELAQDGRIVKMSAKSNSTNVVYGWMFGDGNHSKGNPVKHKYDSAGIYEVCLIAYDTVTKCRVKVCKRVEIKRECNLKADFKYEVDSNGVAYFKGYANNSNAVFGWTFGDSSFARGQKVRHQYGNGKYNACMIAYVSPTCVVRICTTVVVGRKALYITPIIEEESENLGSALDQIEIPNWNASISPNPLIGTATISADRDDISSVVVFSVDGVKQMELQRGSTIHSDFSALPTGFYFIKILASDGSFNNVRFYKK